MVKHRCNMCPKTFMADAVYATHCPYCKGKVRAVEKVDEKDGLLVDARIDSYLNHHLCDMVRKELLNIARCE